MCSVAMVRFWVERVSMSRPLYEVRNSDFAKRPPCKNAVWDKNRLRWKLELESLQDLLDLCKETGWELIVGTSTDTPDNRPTIRIYDSWNE